MVWDSEKSEHPDRSLVIRKCSGLHQCIGWKYILCPQSEGWAILQVCRIYPLRTRIIESFFGHSRHYPSCEPWRYFDPQDCAAGGSPDDQIMKKPSADRPVKNKTCARTEIFIRKSQIFLSTNTSARHAARGLLNPSDVARQDTEASSGFIYIHWWHTSQSTPACGWRCSPVLMVISTCRSESWLSSCHTWSVQKEKCV